MHIDADAGQRRVAEAGGRGLPALVLRVDLDGLQGVGDALLEAHLGLDALAALDTAAVLSGGNCEEEVLVVRVAVGCLERMWIGRGRQRLGVCISNLLYVAMWMLVLTVGAAPMGGAVGCSKAARICQAGRQFAMNSSTTRAVSTGCISGVATHLAFASSIWRMDLLSKGMPMTALMRAHAPATMADTQAPCMRLGGGWRNGGGAGRPISNSTKGRRARADEVLNRWVREVPTFVGHKIAAWCTKYTSLAATAYAYR